MKRFGCGPDTVAVYGGLPRGVQPSAAINGPDGQVPMVLDAEVANDLGAGVEG